GRRLAVRLPAPASQIRQLGPLLGLCLRPACAGCPAIIARLPPEYGTPVPRHRAAGVPACAANGTGISHVQAVKPVVLSGVTGLVLSGARLSCHQAYRRRSSPAATGATAVLNSTNPKALTCYWAGVWRWGHGKCCCIWLGAGS